MFQPGNKYGGARPGAGRKKEAKTLVKEELERLNSNLPNLLRMLYEKAEDGDTKVAQYLIDRCLGKPSESGSITLDARITSFLDLARKAKGLPEAAPLYDKDTDPQVTTNTPDIDVDIIDNNLT